MGRDLVLAVQRRAEISRWLFAERCANWRLGIVVVSELHSATEALWHGVDADHPLAALPSAEPAGRALLATYVAVDRMLGELQQAFPDAVLLAFTPHGMGPNQSDSTSMVLLPELLYRRSTGSALLGDGLRDPRTDLVMPGQSDEAWSDSMRAQYPALQARPGTGRSSWRRRLRARLRSIKPKALRSTARSPLGWMPANWYQPHWQNMDAFALPSFYDGQIRLNLQGREAQGCVLPEHYASLITELETLLLNCTNPRTGRARCARAGS